MTDDALLVDADMFFFYLRGGGLEDQAEKLVLKAEARKVTLYASSEIYDDIISAIRSSGAPLTTVQRFLADMKAIPHRLLPITGEIAEEAISLYNRFGGAHKLHYFDSFHVATAKNHNLTLVTSDKYLLSQRKELEISTMDLSFI